MLHLEFFAFHFKLLFTGFNYAYRRSATVPATPTSANPPTAVPPHKPSAPPSKSATPAPKIASPIHSTSKPTTPAPSVPSTVSKLPHPALERAVPPHLAAKSASNPPSKPSSGADTPSSEPKDSKELQEGNKDGTVKDKETAKTEKAEREKQKKKEKKERKEKEKAGAAGELSLLFNHRLLPCSVEGSAPVSATPANLEDFKSPVDQLKSPASVTGTLSGGTRTPKGSKPARNPWTIFMRMSVPTNDTDLREFYSEGVNDGGVSILSYPSCIFPLTRIPLGHQNPFP